MVPKWCPDMKNKVVKRKTATITRYKKSLCLQGFSQITYKKICGNTGRFWLFHDPRNRVIQRWVRGFESHRFRQRSPHVLIQSMRISFCIYRLINRRNIGYNHQIRAIGAGNKLLGVILSDGGSRSPDLFSPHIPTFRGWNQRFIMECTLLWTIAGYRPQWEVSVQSIAK